MLIYNYQKEFLGIDEKDLTILGFETLADLKAEVSDFADLFVKTPGYVHNFKHVHWIDFIAYADEGEEAKVLINVNAKTFTAKLGLTKAYLADNPSAPAYMIQLNGLRSLSNDETQHIDATALERERPEVVAHQATNIIPTTETPEITIEPTPKQEFETSPAPIESVISEKPKNIQEENMDSLLDVGDLSIDIDESLFQDEETEKETIDLVQKEPELETTVVKQQEEMKEEVSQAAKQLANSGFVYDPTIASRELGLPLDLIEEFIEDFITQANEFKPAIYTSLDEGDIDNVKILAHKLKGVAANLRVEDAHEVLASISATSDAGVIRENMDAFYIIIQRLEGGDEGVLEEIQKQETVDVETSSENFNSEKEDFTIEVADQDIPEKINIPELADDDFYQQIEPSQAEEDLIDDTDTLSLDIEDVEENQINSEIPNDEDKDIEILIDEDYEGIEIHEELPIITYSKEAVANEIGLSIEDFNELFLDFENESKTILDKIKTSAQNNDFTTVHNEALKLKGMSDNMRLHAFTQELSQIMHSQDQEEIIKTINLLDAQLTQISTMGA